MVENDNRYQEKLRRIARLRLIDDEFFNACVQGSKTCIRVILSVILGKPDLKIEYSKPQNKLKNLYGRSVCYDVLARDSSGKRYDIEVQRADKGAGARRARYYSSIMDSNIKDTGENYEKLPETYMIMITERDVLGSGESLYNVDRYAATGKQYIPFGDDAHIIYVNGEKRDESTELGRLMSDFFCTDPDKMYNRELARRVRYFKEDNGGIQKMSRIMEEVWNEGLNKGISEGENKASREAAQRMLADGMDAEKVSKYLNLPASKMQELVKQFT